MVDLTARTEEIGQSRQAGHCAAAVLSSFVIRDHTILCLLLSAYCLFEYVMQLECTE